MNIIQKLPRKSREFEIIINYNQSVDGLGDEFVDEFDRRVQAICEMPERWMVVHNEIRRSLMHRFPYLIYHRIIRKDLLRVILVKHQRRHPKWGLNRK